MRAFLGAVAAGLKQPMESRDPLTILALNSGSSSLKFGLYQVGSSQTVMLASGQADAIGGQHSNFHVIDGQGNALISETTAIACPRDAVVRIGNFLANEKMPPPAAVGHRVVHGGPGLRRHCIITGAVLQVLNDAIPFASLHIPPALEVIRYAQENFPDCPQVACFDTAFHASLPDVARTLPIPKALRAEGIERYGFHGLSCESILHQLKEKVPSRLIIAHLGNGASVTAVRDGLSVDTSMGLTPSGGVIMGTRTGDLDPGVLMFLLRQKKLDAAVLENLVDRQSGLLGISGLDSDMRQLHAAAASNDNARLAVEMFSYSVRKQIAAMIAVLEGIDLLVFTGGIGENDAVVRAMICSGLAWTGLRLDETPGREHSSDAKVRILPAQEETQIARHSWALAAQDRSGDPGPGLE
jgi:acetate kinase